MSKPGLPSPARALAIASATVAVTVASALVSCATRAPEPPPKTDARATARCWRDSIGEEYPGDPDSIWIWNLRIALPDDDLECELEVRSDPKLVEGGWIEERASVRVTEAGGLDGHPILFFFDPPEPRLVSPRPFYLIDNPAMRFRWVVPAEPPPSEIPPIELPPSPPDPPNCVVPRAVLDRLAMLRDSSDEPSRELDREDVVMKWALPFLRSKLVKSRSW